MCGALSLCVRSNGVPSSEDKTLSIERFQYFPLLRRTQVVGCWHTVCCGKPQFLKLWSAVYTCFCFYFVFLVKLHHFLFLGF